MNNESKIQAKKNTVHVVFVNNGGVVQDIAIFRTVREAESYFQEVTGHSYDEICRWEEADRSYDLGIYRCEEFDTQIWEVEIQGEPS